MPRIVLYIRASHVDLRVLAFACCGIPLFVTPTARHLHAESQSTYTSFYPTWPSDLHRPLVYATLVALM